MVLLATLVTTLQIYLCILQTLQVFILKPTLLGLVIIYVSEFNNNLIIQWGRIFETTVTTGTYNKTANLTISFPTTPLIITGSTIDVGDIVDFKSITKTSFAYWIADRLADFDCYNKLYWFAIGY